MVGYNFKIKTYPDGTRQITYYENTVLRNASKQSKVSVEDKGYTSERKKIDNQKRARSEVFDLCRSNSFDYFVTLTIDPSKCDSYDYNSSVQEVRKFTKWLTEHKCSYIIVPEQHVSGRWHFHGLIKGELQLEQAYNHNTGSAIDGVYNLKNYKLGFSTVSKIKDQAKVSTYVVKYLSKDLSVPKGRKRYWCSSGLARPLEETKVLYKIPRNLRYADFRKIIDSDYGKVYFFEFHSKKG